MIATARLTTQIIVVISLAGANGIVEVWSRVVKRQVLSESGVRILHMPRLQSCMARHKLTTYLRQPAVCGYHVLATSSNERQIGCINKVI